MFVFSVPLDFRGDGSVWRGSCSVRVDRVVKSGFAYFYTGSGFTDRQASFDQHFRSLQFFSGDDSLTSAFSSARGSGAQASAGWRGLGLHNEQVPRRPKKVRPIPASQILQFSGLYFSG